MPSSSAFISTTCLPCVDRGEHRGQRLLDRAGHLDHHVDMRAGRDQQRILGHRRQAGFDGAGERGGRVADHRAVLAGGRIGLDGLRRRAVGDRHHPHRVRVHGVDLQHHARGHEARADHADADGRTALRDVSGERAVDEDHGVFLLFLYTGRGLSGTDGTPESRLCIQEKPVKFIPTSLQDAVLIEQTRHGDSRGYFARTYCAETFAAAGLVSSFVQANHSANVSAGTLRGMHYQHAPHGEVKVVRCVMGALHDVIIDLRPDSPTYRQWEGFDLTAENGRIALRAGGLRARLPDARGRHPRDLPGVLPLHPGRRGRRALGRPGLRASAGRCRSA